MSFHASVRFPASLAEGSTVADGFRTTIEELDAGAVARGTQWGSRQQRKQFDVAPPPLTYQEAYDLISLFRCMRGAAAGFRFRDPLNFTTHPDRRSAPTSPAHLGVLNPFIANGQRRVFQFDSIYADQSTLTGSFRLSRITRLEPSWVPGFFLAIYYGTVPIWLNGRSLLPSIFKIAVDYENARVVFNNPPAPGPALVWLGRWDTPVRFAEVADRGLSFSAASGDGYHQVEGLALTQLEPDHTCGPEEHLLSGHANVSPRPNLRFLDGTNQSLINPVGDPWVVNAPDLAAERVAETPEGGPLIVVRNLSGATVQMQGTGGTGQLGTLQSGRVGQLFYTPGGPNTGWSLV